MGGTIGLVLAGGLGTRLRPLTATVPKPLLPVGQRAIVEIVLHQMAAAGLDPIYVSVGYRGYLVKAFLSTVEVPGCRVEVIEEEEPLGTAGPLAMLPRDFDDVFVMNGDVLTRAPLGRSIAHHRASGCELTMLVHHHPVPLPYGLLTVDGGRVVGMREKPTVNFDVATGMYVVSRRAVTTYLVEGERCDMPELVERLLAGGSVGAFRFEESWTDVADLADFERVNLDSAEWDDL